MKYQIIKRMRKTIERNEGYDAIVVVASSANYRYWEWRLSATKDKILPKKTKIICVDEDWEGGAGQLLGTLYAFKKAQRKFNLEKLLKNGGAVAFYHTAGYGKRMAPLCGTEGNNKPAIKLPSPLETKEGKTLLTLLEAVIFSTQIFAKTREGRISVFWGDQVIIPSRTPKRETKLPVEIFGIKKEFVLTPREWRRNWQSYGILIPRKGGGVLQREKLKWKKVKSLLEKGIIKTDSEGRVKIAKSMGCFSVSFEFFKELLKEFSKELELKNRKLDTDPHLWMPLTSTKREYVDEGGSVIYWQRIKKLKERLKRKFQKKFLIGEKNLGKDTLWWDYGNLAIYHKNILKLLENSDEGEAARAFYGVENYLVKRKKEKNLKIRNSILINSEVSGEIKNSVIVNSKIKKASLEKAVLINSQVGKIKGKNLLLYYVNNGKRKMKVLPNEVVTDIVLGEGTKIRMRTSLLRDSKKDWTVRLPQNPFSYSEIERCLARLADDAFKWRVNKI